MKTITGRKADLNLSTIIDTDSYKLSHFLEYPEGMTSMMSYFESRGGEFDTCTLFGLQVIIHRYLAKPITNEDIDQAEIIARAHGEPFNREGWEHVIKKYGGMLPVRIRAIPEGLNIPTGNVMMSVEVTRDPKCFWITNWIETMLSRVWYPSTIATTSREVKKVWKHWLDVSSDNPDAEIMFKHHDFGSRGVTCQEQAMFGGAAHLLSFMGSDTLAGIMCANHYYDCEMSGFSIPATEHSTMTVWGRENERAAVKQWIQKTLVERTVPKGMPKLSACVGDSYNIYAFVEMLCEPEFNDMIRDSGGTLVVRPDSGEPFEVLPRIFKTFEDRLPHGSVRVNSKGYKVLPDHFRIIWGDGINRRSMKEILSSIVGVYGWSASNIAFGSGGGLLQDVNRDTQKFAFKCCYAQVNDKPVDVLKDPITDPGKKSKAGRLDLVELTPGEYKTVTLERGMNWEQVAHERSVMNTVFDNGIITYNTTFEECRSRMAL